MKLRLATTNSTTSVADVFNQARGMRACLFVHRRLCVGASVAAPRQLSGLRASTVRRLGGPSDSLQP
jgi:hypothetical protein